MRKFFKYSLNFNEKNMIYCDIDSNAQDYSQSMGKYVVDESYKSKDGFLRKYFYKNNDDRFKYYDDFLRQHITKNDDILSIASGRCANEINLIDNGYKITCSDYEHFEIYEEFKKWLPNFIFLKLDVLKGPADKYYDKIISLGLIYLFDQKQIATFFKNISQSLKNKGILILDSSCALDNLFLLLFNDFFVKYEAIFFRALKFIMSGKHCGLTIKHNGYRKTEKEIINHAKKYGLILEKKKDYAFLTEFKRSLILLRLLKSVPCLEKIFSIIGRQIPYTRMFIFKKISGEQN